MTTNGSSTPLGRLSQLGQSVWVDFISRDALRSGELERMVREDAVVGLTSNPTIFQKAIASGDAYDEQLREVLEHEDDAQEVFLALAQRDIVDACELLRPVWDEGGGQDGYVSLEVAPTLAYDADATSAEAKRLRELVDRPNLLVKIPGTEPGLQAIEDTIARGISVNVTLLFSLSRHAEVCDAYIRGLERLVGDGGDPSSVASVASFFISRVDTEVDKRLDSVDGGDDLRGKAAIANAKPA
jgi:transaldolase